MLTSLRNTSLGLALALLAQGALGGSFAPISLQARVVKADLIAEVTVLSVTHRNSSVASSEHLELPHTFVTVQLDRIIKGSAPDGGQLTLRLQGGPDGRGRTLHVAGVPSFQPGDRDILFIRNNGRAMCPLVGWELSRMRVVEDQVFDAHGREIWITPDQELVFGPPRLSGDDPSRTIAPLSDQLLNEGEDAEPAFVPPVGSVRPHSDGFAAIVESMVHRAIAEGRITLIPPTRSIRADMPFFIERPRPVMLPDRVEEHALPADEAAERVLQP